MNGYQNKSKLLLLTLAGIVLCSCQKNVTETPTGSGEIAIIASNEAEKAAKSGDKVPDVFNTESVIGLFTQLKVDADLGNDITLPYNRNNSRFNYAVPTWTPNADRDKLLFDQSEPIYIYGYYPHTEMVGSSVTPGSAYNLFNYSVATNQVQFADLCRSDLMWCSATNGNRGYNRQGRPITLYFGHQLCKISLSLRLYNSEVGPNPITKAQVKKITFIGQDIYTRSVFNVLKGTNTPVTNAVGKKDSVMWEPAKGAELELAVGKKSDPLTFINDLILIPFTATDKVNEIRYTLYFPERNAEIVFTSVLPVYDGTTHTPDVADGNKMRFERNDHNSINASIDVKSAWIDLQATIAPWGAENIHELEPTY